MSGYRYRAYSHSDSYPPMYKRSTRALVTLMATHSDKRKIAEISSVLRSRGINPDTGRAY